MNNADSRPCTQIIEVHDFFIEDVIFWANRQLNREGKGYVNPRSVEREHKNGNVRVWENSNGEILAFAIMNKNKMLWNLIVSEKYRGKGIGSNVLSIIDPDKVRVKAKAIGNISKEQKKNWTDPTPFYLKNGFIELKEDFAKAGYSPDTKSIRVMYKPKDEPLGKFFQMEAVSNE